MQKSAAREFHDVTPKNVMTARPACAMATGPRLRVDGWRKPSAATRWGRSPRPQISLGKDVVRNRDVLLPALAHEASRVALGVVYHLYVPRRAHRAFTGITQTVLGLDVGALGVEVL